MNILDHIRIVPDFPKPGIQFYDIATLLAHPAAWKETIRQLHDKVAPYKPDMLMGIESRGFLVAAPLALALGCGFGMVRKKNKLPGKTLSYSYKLEYGEDTIQIQPDLIKPGARIVIVDDLLATGGTMSAAVHLIRKADAEPVAAVCLIELKELQGRSHIDCPMETLFSV